jgi:hypothetical protein
MAKLRRRIPQQTESLFTENHETFFNNIGPKRKFAAGHKYVGYWV